MTEECEYAEHHDAWDSVAKDNRTPEQIMKDDIESFQELDRQYVTAINYVSGKVCDDELAAHHAVWLLGDDIYEDHVRHEIQPSLLRDKFYEHLRATKSGLEYPVVNMLKPEDALLGLHVLRLQDALFNTAFDRIPLENFPQYSEEDRTNLLTRLFNVDDCDRLKDRFREKITDYELQEVRDYLRNPQKVLNGLVARRVSL